MINTIKKHALLSGSSAFSLLMLGFFLYLQSEGSKLLKLDAQWVAISLLPVLIALLVGGYIAKFKGFGIELESKLGAPINSIQLTATDAVDKLPENVKESLPDLDRITEKRKRDVKRLSFISDKKNYYDSLAIQQYIESLPNIEYLEVKRGDGEFVCLLPISLFMGSPDNNINNYTNYNAIERFRISIDEGNVLSEFTDSAITLTVQSSASLLEVLRTLRNNDSAVAGVISKEKRLVGVITAPLVEKRIADEVIGTKA